MRTRAKQKFVAKATAPGAKVPQAQLVVLRNAAAVFYAGFSFFRAVVLEDKNSENYNPVFDSYWKKKSLYPLCLLGYSDFCRCFEL